MQIDLSTGDKLSHYPNVSRTLDIYEVLKLLQNIVRTAHFLLKKYLVFLHQFNWVQNVETIEISYLSLQCHIFYQLVNIFSNKIIYLVTINC